MFELLKNLYSRAELIKGRKLFVLFGVTFILFLLVGIFIGYFTKSPLNQNENPTQDSTAKVYNVEVEREGRITFTDPVMYPKDKIKYVLVDRNGEEIPLRSSDDKLEISQGLDVTVTGKFLPSKDGGKDVLVVDEVIIKTDDAN
jgi:hypothetical protein